MASLDVASPDVASPDVTEDAPGQSRILEMATPCPGTDYPLRVIYCGECGMPVEYCEYHPNYKKCKEWMEKNLSQEMQDMLLTASDSKGADDPEGEKKKRQSRGGRGIVKAKRKTEPQKVCLSRAPRGKKKYVTVVVGLATYDIDLKKASKQFASKFSCGSSVTGEDEIVIQGDCKDDLFDLIPDMWPQIDEESIDDLGDQKRS